MMPVFEPPRYQPGSPPPATITSNRELEIAFAAAAFARITSADENRLGHSRIRFNARVCICTATTVTDSGIDAAAESLSSSLAELRRGNGEAMPKTGAVDQWMLDQVPVTYTTYTIRDEDLKQVGDVPGNRAEQAKLKWSPYTSLLEFVAERFHSAETYIQKLNPGKDWEHLQPGETLKVPNVLPFEVEKFTEGKVPENPAFASRKIFVDTYEHLLEVFDQEQLVCVFPITPGSKTLPAPVGTWKILGTNVWPWFRYDEGMLNHGVRTENYYNLPPGPNNLVGVLWMGLNKPGIGIHGTNNPETIGRAASHGCIRLANWDAARVKDLVSVGNTVLIF